MTLLHASTPLLDIAYGRRTHRRLAGAPAATPSFEQASRFWYQGFMAFDEATFDQTARAFDYPDWAAITLHSYRVRWGQADPDPRYADRERKSKAVRTIDVPTLVIHSAADRCVLVESSAGKDRHFSRS